MYKYGYVHIDMPRSRVVCCPMPSVHPLESLMLDSRVCEAADAQRYISLLAQVQSRPSPSLAQAHLQGWRRYGFSKAGLMLLWMAAWV
jgi:hypothetical protein